MSRGSVEDWKDKSIPTTFQQNVAAADSAFVKVFGQYDVANPHPGYGKDPNILNEFGHTKYPKMLYPNGKDLPGVIVNSQEEEDTALGKASVPASGLRQDGPTLAEFMARGFKAKDYPPHGYASKHSQEEIDKAIADEANPPSW